MSEQNGLPVPTLTELSRDENLLTATPKSQIANESDGSIGSHLLFGLGTLLFVAPMLIPGIPMKWLAVTYVGLMCMVIVGYMLWRAFSALKARQLRR
ncbi:MAG: hypothetical protein SH820_04950 [Xanthomonadales bacterium]|nr:hypothetical protein [Xanthomonadales bacterium]